MAKPPIYLTPDAYAAMQRQGAVQLQGAQSSLDNTRHWTQALGDVLLGLGGQARMDMARKGETDATTAANADLALALQGDTEALNRAMQNERTAQAAFNYKLQAPQREFQAWQRKNEMENAPLERESMQLGNEAKRAQIAAAKAGPKPQFTKIGTDAYGRSQYGWVTPQGVTPYSPSGGNAEVGQGVPPGISPELADIVKQLPPRKRALFNEMVKTGKMDKAIGMLEEKPLPGDAAARIGMLRQTATVIPQLRKLWIKDAKERTSVGETTNYLLGRGDVGEARRLATGAMEGILRAATGAAVTAPEEARYSRMFVPDPTDTLKTRRQKLDALERFSASIEMAIQGGRQLTKLEAENIARKTVKGLGLPVPGLDNEENNVSDDVKKRADEILRKRGIIQ